jgi:hypothetical protein
MVYKPEPEPGSQGELAPYASPASLLRLPPPRRRLTRGKFAPARRGHTLVTHLRSGDTRYCAPVERGRPPVMRLRGGDAQRQQSGVFWAL